MTAGRVGSAGHDDLHVEIGRRLALTRNRYTRGRRTLVDALAAAGRPMTLPDIVAVTPGLAASSAYR
ncbi:MAG TPA: hypothetical protein DEP69_04125, partial [Acidimicrobiaceae bacterium]|nr:hypothetical protein [Acidimicrobiaceae bacterium]